jgi:uncharacterized iron-regulated protein
MEDLYLYYTSSRKKIVVLNPQNRTIKNIEVFNILGQSVYKDDNIYQSTYNEFELNNLNSGNYIIQLSTTDNKAFTKKIIVN